MHKIQDSILHGIQEKELQPSCKPLTPTPDFLYDGNDQELAAGLAVPKPAHHGAGPTWWSRSATTKRGLLRCNSFFP
jgi:hypothetical protein